MSSLGSSFDLRVHHLGAGRVVAWVLVGAAVVGVIDAVRRHEVGPALPGVLALVGVAAFAYVLGLRPAVAEDLRGVEVRNPLRTVEVPWVSMTGIDVTDVLRVHAGETVVRCYAVPRRRPPATGRTRSASSYGFGLPPKEATGSDAYAAGDGGGRPAGIVARTSPAEGRAEGLAVRLSGMQGRYAAGRSVGDEVVTTRWAIDALVASAFGVLLLLAAVLVAVL